MSAGAIGYARENAARFLEELKTLLRIPSVSTTPEHKGDVERPRSGWRRSEADRHGACGGDPLKCWASAGVCG